jgi:hypothetical protein
MEDSRGQSERGMDKKLVHMGPNKQWKGFEFPE